MNKNSRLLDCTSWTVCLYMRSPLTCWYVQMCADGHTHFSLGFSSAPSLVVNDRVCNSWWWLMDMLLVFFFFFFNVQIWKSLSRHIIRNNLMFLTSVIAPRFCLSCYYCVGVRKQSSWCNQKSTKNPEGQNTLKPSQSLNHKDILMPIHTVWIMDERLKEFEPLSNKLSQII